MYQAAIAAVTGLGSSGGGGGSSKRLTPELLLPSPQTSGHSKCSGGSGGRSSPTVAPSPSSLPSPSLPWWSRSMPGTPNLSRTPCSGGGSGGSSGGGANNSPSTTPLPHGHHQTDDFLHSTMRLFLLVTPPVARIQVHRIHLPHYSSRFALGIQKHRVSSSSSSSSTREIRLVERIARKSQDAGWWRHIRTCLTFRSDPLPPFLFCLNRCSQQGLNREEWRQSVSFFQLLLVTGRKGIAQLASFLSLPIATLLTLCLYNSHALPFLLPITAHDAMAYWSDVGVSYVRGSARK